MMMQSARSLFIIVMLKRSSGQIHPVIVLVMMNMNLMLGEVMIYDVCR